MPHVIFYGPNPAAIADDRVYLLPSLEQLGLQHPRVRFVCWMAMYAHKIDEGEIPGPYDTEAAELFARTVLIEEPEIRTLAHLDDGTLAEYFQVPVEQIWFRRIDLDLPDAPKSNGDGT